MKKQVLFFLLMITPMLASAENPNLVTIDKIYYELNPKEKEAEVINGGENFYSGYVDIPESVEYNNVTYSVTSIGDGAFSGCKELTSVFVPASVKSIGDGAFWGCSGLYNINLQDGLTRIGDVAFFECVNLSSIYLPGSLTYLGPSAFEGCTSLYDIYIPDRISSIENNTFWCCSNLRSVFISNSVTSIKSGAFLGCNLLTSVKIPNSVTSIEEAAFYGCPLLKTVIIGSGVTNVGKLAFSRCENLAEVTCLQETVPQTLADAFEESNIGNATLYVPYHAVDEYRNTEPWSGFGKIESIPETIPKKCEKPIVTILPNGKIKVESATEGATCVTNITASNAEPLTDGEISLNTPLNVYTVTAYATKEGYDDSEVATATFRYEKTEGDMNGDGQVNVSDVVQLVNTILSK